MSVWKRSSASPLKICFHFQKAGQPDSQSHRSPFEAESVCKVKLVPYLNSKRKKEKKKLYKLENEMIK
jgi:hypothetical protein